MGPSPWPSPSTWPCPVPWVCPQPWSGLNPRFPERNLTHLCLESPQPCVNFRSWPGLSTIFQTSLQHFVRCSNKQFTLSSPDTSSSSSYSSPSSMSSKPILVKYLYRQTPANFLRWCLFRGLQFIQSWSSKISFNEAERSLITLKIHTESSTD